MHDGSDYGKGLAEIVRDNFTKLGGEVTDFQAITTKETDYSAVLSTVAAGNPEAVYFGGYTAEASVMANQMKTTGFENAVFFGCDGTYGKDFLDRTGTNGEGAFAVSLTPPDSPEKAKFDAAYQAAFGQAPGVLSPFSWNGYDSSCCPDRYGVRISSRQGWRWFPICSPRCAGRCSSHPKRLQRCCWNLYLQ